jgi:hypothetical protein
MTRGENIGRGGVQTKWRGQGWTTTKATSIVKSEEESAMRRLMAIKNPQQ